MRCSSTRAIVCFLPAVNIGPYASSWNSKMAIASIAVGEGSMFQTLGSPSRVPPDARLAGESPTSPHAPPPRMLSSPRLKSGHEALHLWRPLDLGRDPA